MTGITLSSGQASLPTANSTKSFWHSEPDKLLLGHRTTSSLPTEADVVIVGCGMSGTSAAYFLNEDSRGKDLKVVMLEAREACWGATGRNGGHCQPLLYDSLPDIGAFEMRNYQHIKKFVADNDIPCEWRTTSVVHAVMVESIFEGLLKTVKTIVSMDPKIAELLLVVTKESKSPSLADLRVPTAVGAIVLKNAASLWPYKLVCWMLKDLLSKNSSSSPAFNLQTTTPVTHLQKTDTGSWLVHTPRGLIAAKNVLLTTNGYTSHLLPQFNDLIVPVRGEMSSLLPPRTMRPGSSNPPLEHTYGFMGNGKQNINQDDYLIQRPYKNDGSEGHLMFGGGRSYAKQAGVGVSDDSSIDPPAAAYLRKELNIILDIKPESEELEATYEWSGIMGYSRDHRPWVGHVSEDLGGGKGMWVCAGFTGHGMPNTCLSGKAAVDLMLGTPAEMTDLPDSYKITKERIENARTLDEVHIADAKG